MKPAMGNRKNENNKGGYTGITAGGSGRGGVSNRVEISPDNPVPLELESRYGFSAGGNTYIPFFAGCDPCYGYDVFFNNLLSARLQSATQNLCITTKTNYTLGDGIRMGNLADGQREDAVWDAFVKRCNNKPEGLNSLLRKCFETYYTAGNVPVEIVRGTAGGKRFLYVYVKNFLDCRKEWPNGENESEAMIVSRFFRKRGVYNMTEKFNIRIPFYRMGHKLDERCWVEDKTDNYGRKTGNGVYRTALWVKNDVAGYDHYGLPSWVSSMIYGNLEYGSAQFNADNIDNNMVVGGLLVLSGNLSVEEQKKIAKDLDRQYRGAGKQGRTMVIASEQGIDESRFTPFNTHKDGSYTDLDGNATAKIIMANEWSAELLGIPAAGGNLNKSGAYLNELYQQKIKTVIRPVHRKFTDEFLVPLFEIADAWLGTQWSRYEPEIRITNLFDDTTEAATSVSGLNAFLQIVELVAGGQYPLAAAVKLVSARFGLTEQQAAEQLGNIQVRGGNNNNTNMNNNVPDNVQS